MEDALQVKGAGFRLKFGAVNRLKAPGVFSGFGDYNSQWDQGSGVEPLAQ
jgi:hypothetical protein